MALSDWDLERVIDCQRGTSGGANPNYFKVTKKIIFGISGGANPSYFIVAKKYIFGISGGASKPKIFQSWS